MVRRRRHLRARGLTLIEVMIALLVTTVALLGALATVGATVRGANFSRSATEASVLVQSQLEAMVSLPPGTVTTTSPTGTTTELCLDANGSAPLAACTPAYPYTRTTAWGTTADALRRTITVTVLWTDGMNITHQVVATRQKDPQ